METKLKESNAEKLQAQRAEETAKNSLTETEMTAREKASQAKTKYKEAEREYDMQHKDAIEQVRLQEKADAEDYRMVKQNDQKRLRDVKYQLSKAETGEREATASLMRDTMSAEAATRSRQTKENQLLLDEEKKSREKEESEAARIKSVHLAIKDEEELTKHEGKEKFETLKYELEKELKLTIVQLDKEKRKYEDAQEHAEATKRMVDQEVSAVKAETVKDLKNLETEHKSEMSLDVEKAREEIAAAHAKLARTSQMNNKELREAVDYAKEQLDRVRAETERIAKRREMADKEIVFIKQRAEEEVEKAHKDGAAAVRAAIAKHEAEKKMAEEQETIADSEEAQVNKAWEAAKQNAVGDARDQAVGWSAGWW